MAASQYILIPKSSKGKHNKNSSLPMDGVFLKYVIHGQLGTFQVPVKGTKT